MADDGRSLIREITDIVATATAFRYRRTAGEEIPRHELLELQRRKVLVLRAIAKHNAKSGDLREVLVDAERRLQQLKAVEAGDEIRSPQTLETRYEQP